MKPWALFLLEFDLSELVTHQLIDQYIDTAEKKATNLNSTKLLRSGNILRV